MEPTKSRIKQFLAAHTTLALATVSETGHPQAAPLFFAETEELELIFISEPRVRHSQNIAQTGQVAAAIYADGQPWQSIRGIQLEGSCIVLTGKVAETARAVYLAKFPFIAENERLSQMLDQVSFYKIEPNWIRLIDNTRGFGHKEELQL